MTRRAMRRMYDATRHEADDSRNALRPGWMTRFA